MSATVKSDPPRLSLRTRLLRWVVQRLRASGEAGAAPHRALLLLLSLAWGNLWYAASLSYLRHVGRRAAASPGPILECGSGATTLLIGALTVGRGVDYVVLEHNRQWFEHLQRVLLAVDLPQVRLLHAPLVDYGRYRWYDVDAAPCAGGFDLVVCDGPPGSTPGGRYGLLPVMGARLSARCLILLDDTHRVAERRIIEMWRRYRRLRVAPQGLRGRYTEVMFS